jgi:hypothetical protein
MCLPQLDIDGYPTTASSRAFLQRNSPSPSSQPSLPDRRGQSCRLPVCDGRRSRRVQKGEQVRVAVHQIVGAKCASSPRSR